MLHSEKTKFSRKNPDWYRIDCGVKGGFANKWIKKGWSKQGEVHYRGMKKLVMTLYSDDCSKVTTRERSPGRERA